MADGLTDNQLARIGVWHTALVVPDDTDPGTRSAMRPLTTAELSQVADLVLHEARRRIVTTVLQEWREEEPPKDDLLRALRRFANRNLDQWARFTSPPTTDGCTSRSAASPTQTGATTTGRR